jgi:secreted trypsin-like serine protease
MTVQSLIAVIFFAVCLVTVESVIKKPFYKLKPWPRYLDDGYSVAPQQTQQTQPKRLTIYNGLTATAGQFPWQVLLRIQMEDESLFRCGGSIIALTYVLTAAHCLCDSSLATESVSVLAGEFDLSARRPADQSPSRVLIYARQWVCHENYVITDTEILNDIALIQLPLFFRLNRNVSIIAMNPLNVDLVYVGKTAQASGWGMTGDDDTAGPTQLQYFNPTIISSTTCANTFSFVNSSIVCVVSPSSTNIQSICSGDSGGPLVISRTLIGVTSFGSMSCEIDSPQAFTSVRVFIPWIYRKMLDGNLGKIYYP